MEEYNLYDHAVLNLVTRGYLIIVPGITENTPYLRMGDIVRVRRCPIFDGVEYGERISFRVTHAYGTHTVRLDRRTC